MSKEIKQASYAPPEVEVTEFGTDSVICYSQRMGWGEDDGDNWK